MGDGQALLERGPDTGDLRNLVDAVPVRTCGFWEGGGTREKKGFVAASLAQQVNACVFWQMDVAMLCTSYARQATVRCRFHTFCADCGSFHNSLAC